MGVPFAFQKRSKLFLLSVSEEAVIERKFIEAVANCSGISWRLSSRELGCAKGIVGP